jgi:dihydrofolate reductase
VHYEIRVRGLLDAATWSEWFDGLAVRAEGRDTVISGPVTDQAALHGALAKIRDLGLTLLSVTGDQPSGGSMRRVVNSTYVSLDGLIEHLERWHFDYLDDDSNAFEWEQLAASDALLLGRRTYEGFAETWPTQSGGFADKINAMTKYVASTTLDHGDWANTTVLGGDLVEEVAKLKQQPGGDILMYGFGPVAQTLLANGLLDEVRLWLFPVFVGVGGPADLLFREGNAARMTLVGTRTFASGVVVHSYRPAGTAADAGASPGSA